MDTIHQFMLAEGAMSGFSSIHFYYKIENPNEIELEGS